MAPDIRREKGAEEIPRETLQNKVEFKVSALITGLG
jgi:hypothetical protein